MEYAPQTLREDLLALRRRYEEGRLCDSPHGICSFVHPDNDTLLVELFRRWPEFSGNESFPVPDDDEEFGVDPYEAYLQCEDTFGDHEYGRARLRLLDWLIDQLPELRPPEPESEPEPKTEE